MIWNALVDNSIHYIPYEFLIILKRAICDSCSCITDVTFLSLHRSTYEAYHEPFSYGLFHWSAQILWFVSALPVLLTSLMHRCLYRHLRFQSLFSLCCH